MLSVRLARLSVTRPGCRSLGMSSSSLQANNSVDKSNETSSSGSEDVVPRNLNIFGDVEGPSEEEIEAKRRIARMSRRMYNRKFKGVYDATQPSDFEVKQLRKDFVQFGTASGINGGVCWPTKQEMADLHFIDGEFNSTFAQMKERLDASRREEAEQRDAREREIEANLDKLAQWRQEMLQKEDKKKQEELERKAVMEERIREVREYIGYNVDPNDPKFIEVMEMKQAERREAAKEAKKLAKKEKMMQRLMNVNAPTTETADTKTAAQTQEQNPADNKQATEASDEKPVTENK